MNITSRVATTLALLASSSIISANTTADISGIHVVGQAIDGTLVLDDSVSGLSNWVIPGLAMPGSAVIEAAPTLLVIGHVEGFDPQTNTLTVSGQRLALTDNAMIIDAPRDIDATLTAANLFWYLQVGRYVAVAGDAFGGGENLATHIVRLDNEVAPGTAPIYVRGSIDLVDSQGVAYMGGMTLDLQDAQLDSYPTIGSMVELLAYQTNPGSAVVAEYASLETPKLRSETGKVAGINGSGYSKGINGSGYSKGINGSGYSKGINGSGYSKGINGSGYSKGINGSGYSKGINGSGYSKGINGSGYSKGINGSGYSKGINGSGYSKGINGSGYSKGINGSGLQK